MREWYRKPNGKRTKSPEAYVRAWRKMAKRVPEIFGDEWKCYAFDPDFAITQYVKNRYNEKVPARSMTLPVDVLQRLIDLLDNKK
jgi:hypothetical protein